MAKVDESNVTGVGGALAESGRVALAWIAALGSATSAPAGALTDEGAAGDSAPHGLCRREAPPDRPLGGRGKRVADIAIAFCALVGSLPAMLVIALLVRLTSPGPVIFAHERVGFGGRAFRCLKFRTMVCDGDRVLAEHLAQDPAAEREWRESRKLERDPRVTPLGLVLRKTSLDELPQFLNILRGEMSCVGPRPIVAEELPLYGPAVGDYLRSRPGLTGLWQVTGRSSTDYPTRVSLDVLYVRSWSHRADLAILARTVFAVMRFREVV